MNTIYEVPQESGNRSAIRWITCSSSTPSGSGLKVHEYINTHPQPAPPDTSDPNRSKYFQFAALQYDTQIIEDAKHPCDLIGREREGVVLRVDCDEAGLGTASCGPGVKGGDGVEVGEGGWGWRVVLEGMAARV